MTIYGRRIFEYHSPSGSVKSFEIPELEAAAMNRHSEGINHAVF